METKLVLELHILELYTNIEKLTRMIHRFIFSGDVMLKWHHQIFTEQCLKIIGMETLVYTMQERMVIADGVIMQTPG